MLDHQTVISVLFGVVDILFFGLMKVLWAAKKGLDCRMDKLEEEQKVLANRFGTEMDKFKTNYLSRFESVQARLSEVEINIVKEIAELKITMIRQTETL